MRLTHRRPLLGAAQRPRRADLEFGCRQHQRPQPGQQLWHRRYQRGQWQCRRHQPGQQELRQPELGRKHRYRQYRQVTTTLAAETSTAETSAAEISAASNVGSGNFGTLQPVNGNNGDVNFGGGTPATPTLAAGIAPSALGSETPAAGISDGARATAIWYRAHR